MRKKIVGLLTAIAPLMLCSVAHSQSFETISGTGIIERGRQLIRAQKGSKLYQGDRLVTDANSNIFFSLDFNAGIVYLGELSQADMVQISRAGGCIQEQIRYIGELRIRVRPFSCPRSILILISQNGFYRITGTAAECRSTKEKSLCAVSAGTVEAENMGKKVTVPSGFGVLILPGEPPSDPIKIDYVKDFVYIRKHGVITGLVSPLSKVSVNNKDVPVDRSGVFQFRVERSTLGNAIYVNIIDPGGNLRVYPLPR